MNTSAHASCGGCGSSKKVYTPPVTRTPFAFLSLTTGQWRGYSLLARTGWPAGWKYDPQIGRIP